MFTLVLQMTRLSATSRSQKSSGSIVSVLAVDCPSISFTIQTLPLSIVGVLSTPVIFFMLARRAGWIPAFCCLVWMLFTFLLPVPISKLQNHLWVSPIDTRLWYYIDLLCCLRRLIKCYVVFLRHIKNSVTLSKTIREDLPILSKRMRCAPMLRKLYSNLPGNR